MASKKNTKLQFFLKTHFLEFQDSDSERLKALYSDFSNQTILNEYAYKTNVGFWKNVILKSNLQGLLDCPNYTLAIEPQNLASKFQIPVLGKPLSLDCVLTAMEEEHDLMPMTTFRNLYSPPSLLHRLYTTLLHTTFGVDSEEEENVCVVMPTLKHVVKMILEDIKANGDYLITFIRFKSKYAHRFVNELVLTDQDLMCLIYYMQKEHGVAYMDNVQGYSASYQVIKFPNHEENSGERAEIDEHDRAMIALRTTSFALSAQIELFQKQSKELEKECILEKQKGHKAKALYYYKRKKTLDALVETRLKSVETVETVLMKVESSKDDVQVVQAFNMGANALSNLLKSEELSSDSIDEAIEKIHDALEEQKEIEDAIHMGNEHIQHYEHNGDDDDDEELEKELAALVHSEENENQKGKDKAKDKAEEEDDIDKQIAEMDKMFSDIQTSDALPKTTNQKIKELA